MAERPASDFGNRPRTKIVCTLGPSTATEARIRGLLKAGMSVARLNLAHGTPDEHAVSAQRVRSMAESLHLPVSIMADVPGPKYRVGRLTVKSLRLRRNQSLSFWGSPNTTRDTDIPVIPAGLHRDVTAGSSILVDDGLIELQVIEVKGKQVICEVRTGGLLRTGKGVTTPGKAPSFAYLTPQTQRALKFAAEQRVDFIGLSCVRSYKDVLAAKGVLDSLGSTADLVVKIERAQALQNLDSLLKLCDGVMVARGDLGADIPLARVPIAQREIVRRCNQAGKPVITATQMMESMVKSPIPTRAEVTDVATAIFDGSDAVMLSSETSVGRYPLETVATVVRVARETESALPDHRLLAASEDSFEQVTDEAIAFNACQTANQLGAALILAFTESGSTAGRVAKYRPLTPILALTPHKNVQRRLTLRWGVTSIQIPSPINLEDIFAAGREAALRNRLVNPGDLVVLVAGVPIGVPGSTNLLRVMHV